MEASNTPTIRRLTPSCRHQLPPVARFHPELTGRENVFLNGAILGMRREEIVRKFDEIVAFAETDRFLDTPVKRYTTGMYMRLGFAVAAISTLTSSSLMKCLPSATSLFRRSVSEKWQRASKDGRTILLVSHNMAAVESMCKSAVLLAEGRCVTQGNTSIVVQEYLRDIDRACATPLHLRTDREGSGAIRFVSMSLEGPLGSSVPVFQCGAEAVLRFVLENQTNSQLRGLQVSLHILDQMGRPVATLDTLYGGLDGSAILPGRTSVRVVIPKLQLIPGRYRLRIFSAINGIIADWIRNAAVFDVELGDFYGTGLLPTYNEGMFLFDHRFFLGENDSACLKKAAAA